MMTTEATLGYAGATSNAGSTTSRGIAQLAGWGASEGTSAEVVKSDEQARDLAVSLFKQGNSAAYVWEALVSSGVNPATAEAIVTDVLERRRQVDEAARQVAIETSYANSQADEGSFWKGALFALFFAWIALFASFLSSSMGSETKLGIRVVFAIKLAITMVILLSR